MTIRLNAAIGRLLAAAGLLAGAASPGAAGDLYKNYCEPCPPCPPVYVDPCPPSATTDPGMSAPTPADGDAAAPDQDASDAAPQAPAPQVDFSPAPSNNALASSSVSSSNFAPNMVGDLFGVGGGALLSGAASDTILISPGRAAGLQKIAENGSVVPMNRVFINYNYYSDANIGGQPNVNRVTFGLEHMLPGEMGSIEYRIPTAILPQSINFDGSSDAQLGDLHITLKTVLTQSSNSLLGAGIAASLPTASDRAVDGNEFDNGTVRLYPYIGYATGDPYGSFMQTILQFETTVQGTQFNSTALAASGEIEESSIMFLDIQLGKWLYRELPRGRCTSGGITGVAPIIEYHYNQFLGDGSFGGLDGGATPDDFSLQNVTAGLLFEVGGNRQFQLGVGAPISGTDDFNWEFRMSYSFNMGSVFGSNPGARGNPIWPF